MTQRELKQSSPSIENEFYSNERHPVWISVLLHLLPGLLALVVFSLLVRPVESAGFPSIMPWLITVLLVNIPIELGIMLYAGKKRNEKFSLNGIVLYSRHLKAGQVLFWTAITFVVVLVLFVASGPVTIFLQNTVFAWVPDWFVLDTGLNGGFSKESLLIVNVASVFVFIIGIPIIEEMYFRGYLLPRLSHPGVWAIALNSFLFALYHFTTPWQIVTRFLITLPLAYTAYRTKSLLPSILVHALANSVDVIMGFAYVFGK